MWLGSLHDTVNRELHSLGQLCQLCHFPDVFGKGSKSACIVQFHVHTSMDSYNVLTNIFIKNTKK